MKVKNKTNQLRKRRGKRTRVVIAKSGRLRLSVFRSHRHIYAGIINDSEGKTLAFASSMEVKDKLKKAEKALAVGKKIAEKAAKIGVDSVVFDRGRYRYHGRVKSLAEGARSGGLKF